MSIDHVIVCVFVFNFSENTNSPLSLGSFWFSCCELACLGVSSLVCDAVDGVQQTLLVTVRVQLELCAGVVTELDDGDLQHETGT